MAAKKKSKAIAAAESRLISEGKALPEGAVCFAPCDGQAIARRHFYVPIDAYEEHLGTEISLPIRELAIQLQKRLAIAQAKYPWPQRGADGKWPTSREPELVILQRQALACAAEAGELAAAVAKDHGDQRISEEAWDTIVTAYRVLVRQ